MAFLDHLDRTVDLVDRRETAVDGDIATDEVTVAAAVPCRIRQLRGRSVVYAADGTVVTDHQAIAAPTSDLAGVTVGHLTIDADDGRCYVVSERPSPARDGDGGLHHWTIPLRLVTDG